MNRVLVFWIAVLFMFSGLTLFWLGSRYMRAGAVGATSTEDLTVEYKGDPLTEFELIDQKGNRFNSNDLDGQVWAGSFFFSSCPSTCYQQNIRLQQLQVKFAERGLQMVSITCDPVNDTPVTLSRYASRFNADPTNWRFLTTADGDMRYIQRVGNDFFNLMVDASTHSDRVVVFDREGATRGSFSVLNGEQYANLESLLDEVLNETVESNPEVSGSPEMEDPSNGLSNPPTDADSLQDTTS